MGLIQKGCSYGLMACAESISELMNIEHSFLEGTAFAVCRRLEEIVAYFK